MKTAKKRSYDASARQVQAQKTRIRIVHAAEKLFQSKGFEKVKIAEIAQKAEVAEPTVYSIFQSKIGVLQAIVDAALPLEEREALVRECVEHQSPTKRLEYTAKLTRRLYDAENRKLDLLTTASILDPIFKKLEQQRELRRYERQAPSVIDLAEKGNFADHITAQKAQDIIWAFTGRDLYRMLVIERKWSSDEYESWLASLLIKTLLKK